MKMITPFILTMLSEAYIQTSGLNNKCWNTPLGIKIRKEWNDEGILDGHVLTEKGIKWYDSILIATEELSPLNSPSNNYCVMVIKSDGEGRILLKNMSESTAKYYARLLNSDCNSDLTFVSIHLSMEN